MIHPDDRTLPDAEKAEKNLKCKPGSEEANLKRRILYDSNCVTYGKGKTGTVPRSGDGEGRDEQVVIIVFFF